MIPALRAGRGRRDLPCLSAASHDVLRRQFRHWLIEARRAGNDERARQLSQTLEYLKRYRFCCRCGVLLSNQGRADSRSNKRPMRCMMCCAVEVSRQPRRKKKR